MDEPFLRIEGLVKRYGDLTVLDGVDLTVEKGEAMIILGGSGSGKSTLLRCALGLETPDEGKVWLDGVDVHNADDDVLEELRERIGVSFQSSALFGSMTVAENVDLPLREHTDLPPSTRSIVVRLKLSLVGLGGSEDSLPSELSGGMRKRAALARAMALDPEILFCDEPSAGLDPVTAAGVDRLLNRLKRVFGVTLVVVTHELESAFVIGDRFAFLHRGKIRALGTEEELKGAEDEVVRRFLGREPDEADERSSRFEELVGEELPTLERERREQHGAA